MTKRKQTPANYIHWLGGKGTLVKRILKNVGKPTPGDLFLDLCAGAGSVSLAAAAAGFNVYACDVLSSAICSINGVSGVSPAEKKRWQSRIDTMNRLKPTRGYLTKNFSPDGDRWFLTQWNAGRLDAVRAYIEGLRSRGDIGTKQYEYLRRVALSGLVSVQNTCGHQISAIKSRFKETASKDVYFRSPSGPNRSDPDSFFNGNVTTYNTDLITFLEQLRSNGTIAQVAYLDPPYTERQYEDYNNLSEIFVRNDRPKVHGVHGQRVKKIVDRSPFCSKRECEPYFERVVSLTPADRLFVSYSTDGIMSKKTITDIMSQFGCVRQMYSIPYSKHIENAGQKKKDDGSLCELLYELRRST